MTDTNITYAEILEIEEKARVLRAEALQYGISAFTGWVKSAFSLRGAVQNASHKQHA